MQHLARREAGRQVVVDVLGERGQLPALVLRQHGGRRAHLFRGLAELVAIETLRSAGWTTVSHIEGGRLVRVPLEMAAPTARPTAVYA